MGSISPLMTDSLKQEDDVSMNLSSPPLKKDKRKSASSEDSEEEKAPRKKRQRNFQWTEKNKTSFEKCQTVRALKQAVERQKKELGLTLIDLIESNPDAPFPSKEDYEASLVYSQYVKAKNDLAVYLIAHPPKEKVKVEPVSEPVSEQKGLSFY
jgi:hypothetical protein